MNDPAYAVQICKTRPDFFRFENPTTQVAGFGPNPDDLGHQIFKSKNRMLSNSKMLSTTVNSSRTIGELDGDSCIATLLRARRAVGASLRGQTTVGGRGLGPRDQEQRTRLREYVLIDYTAVQQQRQQSATL